MALLQQSPPMDYSLDLIDVLKANASTNELMELWLKDSRRRNVTEQPIWLTHGLHLGCLPVVTASELEVFRTERPMRPTVFNTLYRARRLEVFENTQDDFDTALDSILALDARGGGSSEPRTILETAAQSFGAGRYAIAFGAPQSSSLSSAWDTRRGIPFKKLVTEFSVPDFSNAHNLEKFISEIVHQSDRPAVDWATQLAPWDAIAEKGRSFWGDRWAFYQLANLASGIRSSKETSSEHPNLFDRSVSLCGRARYARLRAGVPGWWSKQLDNASHDSDKVFLTMLWMTWGSPATLLDCEAFDTFIESLSENEWSRLYYVITDAMVWTKAQPGSREVSLDVKQLPKRLSARTVSLLRLRANDKSADELYLQRLRKYKGGDLLILSSSQNGAIRFLDKDSNWNPHLQVVSRSFKAGVVAERYSYHTFRRNPRGAAVPLPTAIKIMERAELYPSYLVATAEARCKEEVATRLVPVAETARREGWFSE